MAGENAKHIPIMDGDAEAKKAEAEAREAETAETGAGAEESRDCEESGKCGCSGEESKECGDNSGETHGGSQDEEPGKGTKDADAEAEPEADAKAKTEAEAEADAKAKTAEADGKSSEEAAAEQESERYMRLMAEFQNFKRRAAKEKSDIHAFANERIVGDLLPVLDNFERALATETDDKEAYAKGMELIFEQLKAALEKAGVKEIEALGCDFDPNVHNAVMTDNTDEYETDKISKVLQKGYKLNDRVVRPSMVAVNKK